MKKILIKNGLIYDPVQKINGTKSDIYIADGKITESFPDPEITIDADERAVFAGGIDPYVNIAAPGLDYLHRNKKLPSLKDIGLSYAKCGYVHIHQPLTPLLTAGYIWHSLNQIPYLDKSVWATLDLRDLGRHIKANKTDELISQSNILLKLTGAIGLFLPYPYLKHKQRHYMHMNISQKKIFELISAIKDQSFLPVNIMGNPGIFDKEITVPENFHISDIGNALTSNDVVQQACEFMDAGGSASIRLGDGNEKLIIRQGIPQTPGSTSLDIGLNHPLGYSLKDGPVDKEAVRLIWSLLSHYKPTWRLSITCQDYGFHSDKHIPVTASWLICQDGRPDFLKGIPDDQKFDIYEYTRMTRSEPARILGFNNLGNLKNGSKASIAVYDINTESDSKEIQKAFSNCWLLVKNGEIVIENGNFTDNKIIAEPIISEVDIELETYTNSDILQRPTLRWENLAVNFEITGN